jgi:hypothetical protein
MVSLVVYVFFGGGRRTGGHMNTIWEAGMAQEYSTLVHCQKSPLMLLGR